MEAFMNSNRLVLDAEQDDKLNILSLAALFQGDFSLDWLQYLARTKASLIIASIKYGIEKKWLADKGNSFFRFADTSIQNRQPNLVISRVN